MVITTVNNVGRGNNQQNGRVRNHQENKQGCSKCGAGPGKRGVRRLTMREAMALSRRIKAGQPAKKVPMMPVAVK